MNTQEIALALTEGTNDLWVTFPEGWRREQIAAELAKVYQAQSVAFNTDAFLVATEGKEGYLYPDTYLFPLAASPESIAEHLLTTFDQKVLQTYQADFNQSPYTVNQIITMASLVEREAKTDADRPLVAGILWKRLENDWPLQVDATLQYALGLNPQTQAWTPPTALDKTVDSPYNTYLHPGLPPAPICSPSLDSIRAVLNPIQSPYWFYLTDNQNNTHYAITLDEHNQNINQFLR
jgi:UPF0755 protein